ncbi:MAG: 3-phosphoserine/phosphohydroxythreonine transaminase [Planctomycetes bacterium]|nr:3-phosphoserine/phosphohydroxythreonine transaminase [Planctomycetota bacterium]
MTERSFNFSAGPATLPQEVLEASAKALVNFEDTGTGIAEVSHRGKEFSGVLAEAQSLCRELLDISDDYQILFLQGGASQQFNLIPMNFLHKSADYLNTGQWAKKAIQAAEAYGNVTTVASSADDNFNNIPQGWASSDDSDYLHICTNNTIFGTRISEIPNHPRLIADMSSEIMSRKIDVSKYAMIYAGAQKNLGPSGVVLAIIRKDFLASAKTDLADIFSYQKHAAADSCLNTPPTFGIYMLLENFRWLKRQGGIAAIEERNERKAALIYNAIDNSNGFYTGTVNDLLNRSRMNITFTLAKDDLTAVFISEAAEKNMVALKGYRSVGGIRASTYNAMPEAGCSALAEFMVDFAKRNS